MPFVACLVVASLVLSGCYKNVEIRKDQLPKLNGSYQRVTGAVSTGSGTVYTGEVTVAHVAAPDGRNVEIKGEFDAVIHSDVGESTFEHPVTSTLEGSALRVTGANRPTTRFDIERVSAVEVTQYDGTASALAILGGSAAFGVVFYFALMAAIGR
jgi:hypothetical protein